jgi:hypothetical protein
MRREFQALVPAHKLGGVGIDRPLWRERLVKQDERKRAQLLHDTQRRLLAVGQEVLPNEAPRPVCVRVAAAQLSRQRSKQLISKRHCSADSTALRLTKCGSGSPGW